MDRPWPGTRWAWRWSWATASRCSGLAVRPSCCPRWRSPSITLGTVWQKRHGGAIDLRTGAAIQFAAAAVVLAPFAFLLETRQVRWSGEFVFALAWLVLVLSFGAIFLLLYLIRHGAATRVASLFYLVPPTTALIAWPLFGETYSTARGRGHGTRYARGVAGDQDRDAAHTVRTILRFSPTRSRCIARLRDEDPAHWSPLLKAWVLTRYDDVKRVCLDARMSSDRLRPFFATLPSAEAARIGELIRYLTLWMVFRDPPEHTRLRRLAGEGVQRALHACAAARTSRR